MTSKLSTKELNKREFLLHGNLFKVIGFLTIPLLVYSLFNYLYGIVDIFIVSSSEMTSVIFIEEIKNAISAFGSGIAVGGTVIVARLLGKNDIDKAKEAASQVFVFALLVSIGVSLITSIFAKDLLILLRATDNIIANGVGYFIVQMLTTTIMAMNSVFIGLEKSKGNTSIVLKLNLSAMVIKILLSLLFVKVFHLNATFVAIATLIAQLFILSIGFKILFSKNNSLKIVLKGFKFKKDVIKEIFFLSIPIFIGKFLFSIGKVLINIIATSYGDDVLTAFGLAVRVPSIASSMAGTFEDTEVAVVSQNLGNRNLKRTFQSFFVSVFYSVLIAIPLIILITIFFEPILSLTNSNTEENILFMARKLFYWERWSALTSALIGVTTNLFVGYKKTSVSFILNIVRIFVLRIPVLYLLQFLGIDYMALGVTMFISNLVTLLVGVTLFLIFYFKVRNYGYQDILYSGAQLQVS
ncbi:MAG: hypothetical protein LBV58_02420 [Acholeplasmatales bacterium]|jgi:putative MATE family efflux protein|nr:hypothetical protein [Acholeplasmatales bacterium]